MSEDAGAVKGKDKGCNETMIHIDMDIKSKKPQVQHRRLLLFIFFWVLGMNIGVK